MTIDVILAALDKVQSKPNGKFMACCPAHDDRTPSLAVQALDDGRVLMHCFGCGATGVDVLAALGMGVGLLFPDGAINDRLMGWATIEKRRNLVTEKKKEQSESNDRVYLLSCDAFRLQGKKLTSAELEKEREAYKRVNA